MENPICQQLKPGMRIELTFYDGSICVGNIRKIITQDDPMGEDYWEGYALFVSESEHHRLHNAGGMLDDDRGFYVCDEMLVRKTWGATCRIINMFTVGIDELI